MDRQQFEDQAFPIDGRTLVVDFVVNDVPIVHPYFGILQTPRQLGDNSSAVFNPSIQETRTGNEDGDEQAQAKTYWDGIFASAVQEFCTTSNDQRAAEKIAPAYDIRTCKTWAEVREKLEEAHDCYANSTGSGSKAKFLRRWRRLADNAAGPARNAIKLVPNINIISPVLTAVGVILDAVSRSSNLRCQMAGGLKDIENVMKDVEKYLATFPEEEDVKRQAVVVSVSVLAVIEMAIAFFVQSIIRHGTKALFQGDQYGQPLLDAVKDLGKESEQLRHIAHHAHMRGSKDFYQKIWKRFENMETCQEDSEIRQGVTETRVDGLESTLSLLMDYYARTTGKTSEKLYTQKYHWSDLPVLSNPSLAMHSPPLSRFQPN
ncbi:hypothetical protein F5Y17DRAFT_452437 [Xylariaceae sp. FL0594]|nr:hypothetical protein F5Y17DRAFT_452437 [Xylariaceae sp. FL0594]